MSSDFNKLKNLSSNSKEASQTSKTNWCYNLAQGSQEENNDLKKKTETPHDYGFHNNNNTSRKYPLNIIWR